jgi:hypothetical protein
MQESGVNGNLMLPISGLGQPGSETRDSAPSLLQLDLERGLRFAHVMMSINQFEGREGAVYARALAELLVNKGTVAKEELEAMMAQVRQEVEALPAPKVMLARSIGLRSFAKNRLLSCRNPPSAADVSQVYEHREDQEQKRFTRCIDIKEGTS